MRIDLGLILAIVIEYILFIYYADTLFYRKRNKYLCYGIIAVGYMVHMITCMFGNVALNVLVSVAVNFIGLLLCYYVTAKTATFQSVMLLVFMMADEWLVAAVPYLNISFNPLLLSPQQSFILTMFSRILYLVEIMYVSRIFYKDKKHYETPSLMLITIPLMSVMAIFMLIALNINSSLMSGICLIITLINLVIFAFDQKMFRKELETVALKEQIAKESIDYEEYTLLSEKYEQTRVFRHDLKEHLSVLNALIDENPEKAKCYIRDIFEKEENMQFARFSNNKILNILLSKKKAECMKHSIEFLIEPIQADVDFINDMDIVTLFSNLINNAIESCVNCTRKKIYLSISTVNENFIVIKMENTCATKPIIINSRLHTGKGDPQLHGVGMSSIKRALKTYNGLLTWSYNDNEKTFLTTIIINKNTAKAKK